MIGKDMKALYGQKFADSLAVLSINNIAQVQKTIKRLLENPERLGLNVEKIGDDSMFSARVNDNFRLIFSIPEGSNLLCLLYVGPHEAAYQFADRHKLEINPITGGLQQVEKQLRRMTVQPDTGRRLSRLSGLDDSRLVSLNIPEEYWPQLREKVFTVGQLLGFRQVLPQDTYDTLEFILDGAPVDEAMELWKAMHEEIIPAEVKERVPMFEAFSAEDLISVGIPRENVDKISHIRTDKELEIIAVTLPVLAQQSLYALKAGETIEDIRRTTYAGAKRNEENDFETALQSPITLAEFAPIHSEEALRAILEYPSEKWRVFLHPTQTEIIRQDYNGPARIVGGAGTGKTVVIVHRARRLASECTGDERILVTTYGNTLKHDIDERIRELCSEEELEHIDVYTVDKLTHDLARTFLKQHIIYTGDKNIKLADLWGQALEAAGLDEVFSPEFCVDEWQDVIQAQNITSLDAYQPALRYGRGKQLDRAGRKKFWQAAEEYMRICTDKKQTDPAWAQNRLTDIIKNDPQLQQYKSLIVDECQDLRASALRMLRALAGKQRKNDIYLSGDTRQRIYGGHVSLSQCGIKINNRSRVLKLNYRTTEEIYSFAMQFQREYQYDDMDGRFMSKDKCNCIFHGPAPFIHTFTDEQEETLALIGDIQTLIDRGIRASDICIMVRSVSLVISLMGKLKKHGLPVIMVDNHHPDDKKIDGIRIMTMHRGKGMEYAYVYLPRLRDDQIPRKQDIDKAEDETMLNEVMLSEANLLSVAITRAKYRVWLSYSGTPSRLIREYIR